MPSKVRVFVQFHILPSAHPSYTGKCAALTKDGRPCPRWLKCDISPIDKLHAKLQHDDGRAMEDREREDTLREIAKLCLCSSYKHNGDGCIEAAVRQWNAEIRSQAGPLVDPQTPPRNVVTPAKHSGGLHLGFEPYLPSEIKKLVDNQLWQALDRKIDKDISAELIIRTDKGEDAVNYLYIFSRENEKGMYKVGHTKGLKRVTHDHERCYPRLVVRKCVECPNAQLIERLVHLEFARYHHQRYCGHCNKMHREWFDAPYEHLMESINKWSRFSRILYSGDTWNKQKDPQVSLVSVTSGPHRWHE
ncbi:hypothetical protein BDW59DRAFT_114819 [Aspergillus cavernicola]|uniref:Bacteriophage T5 Orf172 DNA-binding domain-containing protein n=1 Tax=Aspergillus cavernicola TaxID=176166 RepID=A0ABR4IXL8_9EURO